MARDDACVVFLVGLILEHHPDKKKGSAEEEEEKMIFLRIQVKIS